jgi:hypothetical protein
MNNEFDPNQTNFVLLKKLRTNIELSDENPNC